MMDLAVVLVSEVVPKLVEDGINVMLWKDVGVGLSLEVNVPVPKEVGD